jgi:exportin-1
LPGNASYNAFTDQGTVFILIDLSFFFLQVESGALTEPLWDAATVPFQYPNNTMFVREYTIKLLSTSFPNMTAAEVY